MYLSGYNREEEKRIRRQDIYSFYFYISDQKERADKSKKGNLSEKFGREA